MDILRELDEQGRLGMSGEALRDDEGLLKGD